MSFPLICEPTHETRHQSVSARNNHSQRRNLMIRGIILGAALSLAFLQPAHALLVCARSDPDTGLPKERSRLFLRTACITGREVPVGIELIGTPGTDGEV